MKIILITQGLSRLLLPLINSGHNVVGIIESMPRDFTEKKKTSLLFRILRKCYSFFNNKHQTLKNFCEEKNIKYTYICKGRDKEIDQWVKNINPDLIVVFSMSQLLRESIFRQPKHGTINMHPSYLPEYRGANPDFWQYYNMEMNPGVTIHYIDEGEDTGDIIYQERVHIPLGTKSPERLDKLIAEMGVPLMLKAINDIKTGIAPKIPQSKESPTPRAKNLTEQEHATIIKWDEWPIERIWHILRGTELWLNAYEQPKGIYKGHRWSVGEFVKAPNIHTPGGLVTYQGEKAIATPEGYIFISVTFSLKKLLIKLLQGKVRS